MLDFLPLAETAHADEGTNILLTYTLSSRYDIKQAHDRTQNLWEKTVEPLLVRATLQGKAIRPGFQKEAYLELIRCHAHDSICGCAVQDVHRDMFYRYRQATEIGECIINDCLRYDVSALSQQGEKNVLLLRVMNSLPYSRKELVRVRIGFEKDDCRWFSEGERFYESKPSFAIFDHQGNEVPYTLCDVRKGRVEKTPTQYLVDYVEILLPVSLQAMGYTDYEVRPALPSVRNRYLREAEQHDLVLENAWMRVDIQQDGRITLLDKKSRRIYRDLLGLKDSADIGDGWMQIAPAADYTVFSYGSPCILERLPSSAAGQSCRIRLEMRIPETVTEVPGAIFRSERYVSILITKQHSSNSLTRAFFLITIFVLASAFMPGSDVHAENLNFSASVAPSLRISIPDNIIELELNPTMYTPDFNTVTATINIATNNPTAYNLSLNADSTNLTRTFTYKSGENFLTSTISTITATANSANFPLNSWGYKIGNNAGDNYLPFATTNQLRATTTTTNNDEITLSFAAKTDLSQQSGIYELSMNVIAVTNYVPLPPTTLQETTLAKCLEFADDAPLTVTDTRDNEAYNIRYVDGNCWMVDNLRLAPETELTSANSNIAEGTTWTMPADSTTNFDSATGYTTPGVHIPTTTGINNDMDKINNYMTTNSYPPLTATQVGAWYNYCAATAGTICYETSDPHAQDEAEYDICPSGWKLPNGTQQSSVTGYVARFTPVRGGRYYDGSLYGPGLGYWWSSTAGNAASRYYLYYDGSGLDPNSGSGRCRGQYVRCVAKS